MKATILLIEDNEQNRYLATFLLESKGHTVVTTPDGQSGLEIAARQRFNLILLDIQLPVMDGYAVARALRANAATKDIPIVAVTSYAMMGDREKAIDSGCNGYIEKPIRPETFVSEIEKYLSVPEKD